GKSYGELYQSICQTEPDLDSGGWDQVSAEAKDCIRLMLTKDPAKRPTATALLAHKWFKQASKHTKPLGNMVLNRMRAFAAMNNFKKEVIWLVSLNLSEEYLGGLSSMFRAMDKDRDGFLSCAEGGARGQEGGAGDHQQDQREQKRLLGFEFVSAAMNQALLEKKDLLRHAFDYFDLDKEEAIYKKKAAAMLHKLGRLSPPAVDQALAAIKFDAEGKLGFPEFCTLMSGTPEFQGVRNGLLHRVRTAVTEPGGILSTQQRVPDTVPNIQRPGEVRNTNLYTAKYQAVGSQSGSGHRGPHYAISPQHGNTLAAGSPRDSAANLTALSPHSSNGQPSLAPGGGSGSYPSTSTGLLLLP
ncbi:calcium-dependent protein kinase 21-like isoform X3, partial [Haematococcus lacustris]